MQRVNKALYDLLREWLPEEASIYPGIASEDAAYPYCVYNPDSFETRRTKEGVYGYDFRYGVDVWGCTFNQVDRYATLLMEQAGDVRFNTPAGRLRMWLVEGVADYVDGAFVQKLTFNLRYDGEAV